ncbi:hypothetical protein C8J57DRAFT_1287410 [Mycena rebaudengoi]|nr:hypothetical protein C8J57DRAFT_1287410 [Mycena rebaudengoi]
MTCQLLMPPSVLDLFCCCGHRGVQHDEDTVDETSHLIPSNLDSSTPPTAVFTDHQRMQERLITIVRAKERKMVNVNSQIPFNLHNRVITPNPSLSRSVSLSIGHRELRELTSTAPAFPDTREPLTVQLRSPPSPLGSAKNGHASRSQSRSISLSRNYSDEGPPTQPILNVRLVNATQPTVPQRVGRPRHRAFGSPSSSEYSRALETRSTDLQDSQSVSIPTPTERNPASSKPPDPKLDSLDQICLSWGDSDP